MASQALPVSICTSCLRTALRHGQRQRLQGRRLGTSGTRFLGSSQQQHLALSMRATFSSSSTQSLAASNSSKPIVLEEPDKFRPPSHPQRLGRRRPSPAAYNQGTTQQERQQQKNRSYPHMFPNQGSFMHWFLTNRAIHLWITMGTLMILASISLTQTFLKTSPYAHLIPPISTLLFHPINYIRESLSVIRLHIDYTTEKTNASRQQKILDAQKRRLYRRAHGMEDLNAEEEEGIDVRGIVPWDDGLTNKERARGGREERVTGLDVLKLGGNVGDDVDAFAKDLRDKKAQEGKDLIVVAAGAGGNGDGDGRAGVQHGSVGEGEMAPPQQQRKRKLFFGIW